MKKIILLIGLFLPISGFATHIVGGEIVLTHVVDQNYKLALILYFDEVYGNPGAIDANADIHIFKKNGDEFIKSFTLPIQSDTYVEYTNPDCATGDLITRRIYYATEISLENNIYTDNAGYYLVYERCCRNQVIQNIFDPGGAGQTFYLEIPPVIKEGVPFINSTPELFPPLSDYACLNQPFYFDFGGTDVDGDSLVYSLSTPLNGNSTRDDPLPPPSSGPYPEIQFQPSYSLRNMIRGNPSLSIDQQTGQLTITPTELGLFVFAVRCEEYRDGVRIGEVRRDYQMLVLDCPEADPPVLGLNEENGVISQDFGAFEFNASLTDNCFTVYAADPNPSSILIPRIIPITQPNLNVVTVSPGSLSTTLGGTPVEFQVCLAECPELVNDRYEFYMVVGDNSCSLPLLDTIRVAIDITLENNPPQVSTDLIYNNREDYYEVDVEVGTPLNFEALGLDTDLDSLVLRAIGDGFNLASSGFDFGVITGRGEISREVEWIPTCEFIPEGDTTATLFFDLVLEDYWECGKKSADTTRVKVNLFYNPEENPGPEVQITSLTPTTTGSKITYFEEIIVGDSVVIDLEAIDPNGDFIAIEGSGLDLLGLESGALQGISPLNLSFIFNSSCELLGEGVDSGEYLITFIAKDERNCSTLEQDTVELLIRVIDIPQIASTKFPNAFSPNGDNSSETFKISNLPIDNCNDSFESITIYNRWGEEVFTSELREFEWNGFGYPAGSYYYLIKYRNSEYKGNIMLLTDTPKSNN